MSASDWNNLSVTQWIQQFSPSAIHSVRAWKRLPEAWLRAKGFEWEPISPVTIDLTGEQIVSRWGGGEYRVRLYGQPSVLHGGLQLLAQRVFRLTKVTVTVAGASEVRPPITMVIEYSDPPVPAVDPLDVEYDGQPLRDLLTVDEILRCDWYKGKVTFTPTQRAAVSAHWSAELRAKVAARKQRDAEQAVRIYAEVDDV